MSAITDFLTNLQLSQKLSSLQQPQSQVSAPAPTPSPDSSPAPDAPVPVSQQAQGQSPTVQHPDAPKWIPFPSQRQETPIQAEPEEANSVPAVQKPFGGMKQQALEQFYKDNPAPQWSQEHISKGQRILAAVLGGFAGANNGALGAETARRILEGPFTKKSQDYQARLQRKIAERDDEWRQEKDQEAHEAQLSLANERSSRAAKEDAQAVRELYRANNPWKFEKPMQLTVVMKPEDGSEEQELPAIRTPTKDGLFLYTDIQGRPIDPKLITGFKNEFEPRAQPKVPTPEQSMINAYAKEHGVDPKDLTYAQRLQIVKDTSEGKQPAALEANRLGTIDSQPGKRALTQAETMNAMLRSQQLQNELQGQDANTIASLVKGIQQDPQRYFSITDKVQRSLVDNALAAADTPIPRKLSPKSIDLRIKSNNTLSRVKDIENKLMDPDVRNNLGALGYYDETTRKWLGTSPLIDPKVQQKMQAYRSALQQLFVGEIQALTGVSARTQMMDHLKEIQAKPRDAVHIVRGILDQAKQAANDTNENVHKEEGTSSPDLGKQIDKALEQFLKPTVKRN